MRVGDVVTTKNIRVQVSGERITGTLGYAAPKGEVFVFVLLGSQPLDGPPLDPIAAFEALGWKRETPETSHD